MSVEQYKISSAVDAYNILFGENWICTGGQHRIANLLKGENIKSGIKVLDIGCGKGAAAFELVRGNDVSVDGIDIEENFLEQAKANCKLYSLDKKVHFLHGDILDIDIHIHNRPYDFILSIDTFLHIHRKAELFNKIRTSLLKTNGKMVFEDYCVGIEGKEVRDYAKKFDYDLLNVENYSQVIAKEGFNVAIQDLTDVYLAYSKNEYEKAKKYGFSWWEDVLEKRIFRVSNGQHLLIRFSCTPIYEEVYQS